MGFRPVVSWVWVSWLLGIAALILWTFALIERANYYGSIIHGYLRMSTSRYDGDGSAYFPSLTICPQFQNITDVKEARKNLQMEGYTGLPANTNTSEFIKELQSRIGPMENLLVSCVWRNKPVKCTKYFQKILTEEGLCFSFNMFPLKANFKKNTDIGLETVFDESFLKNKTYHKKYALSTEYEKTHPRMVHNIGHEESLHVELLTPIHSPILGYKLFIHNPLDVPVFNTDFIRLPHKTAVEVAVKPRLLIVERWKTTILPEFHEECYQDYYNYLKTYKYYTQKNCQLECFTKVSLEICKCVPFYIPRDQKDPVCSEDKRDCILKAIGNFSTFNNCKCPLNCETVDYEKDVITHPTIAQEAMDFLNMLHLEPQRKSYITVYIKDVYVAIIDEYYSHHAVGNRLTWTFFVSILMILLISYKSKVILKRSQGCSQTDPDIRGIDFPEIPS